MQAAGGGPGRSCVTGLPFNDAAAVALAVDLLAFATPDRGALLKRRSARRRVPPYVAARITGTRC